LQAIKSKHGSIKEYPIVVAIAIRRVNIVEALRELDEGSVITVSLVQREADCRA
jgi:hypothetical protein